MANTTLRLLVVALGVAAVLAHSGGVKDSVLDVEAFTHNMMEHFDVLSEARHPRERSREAWTSSRAYIKKAMEMIGLDVELQCFNTSVQLEYEEHTQELGCNIIGVSKGDSDKDRLVVGAHYDSSGEKKNNEPLRNNGAGAALLLEVAKAYEESTRWKGFRKNYTTIFVAFDLNTKEQFPESLGQPGSHYFVDEWLEPLTRTQRLPIAGAYILDSISTYNTADNSQILPADFKNFFKDAYSRIYNDTSKGNFIAAIAPKGSADLVTTFSGHYRMDRRAKPYRLQEMIATDRMFGAGPTLQMLNHQAAFRFWVAKPTIPAVLITDTDVNRIKPAGEECNLDCNYIFANPQRMKFIASTYQALCHTLLDKQTTYVELTESGSSASVSCLGLVLSTVLVQLLVR